MQFQQLVSNSVESLESLEAEHEAKRSSWDWEFWIEDEMQASVSC